MRRTRLFGREAGAGEGTGSANGGATASSFLSFLSSKESSTLGRVFFIDSRRSASPANDCPFMAFPFPQSDRNTFVHRLNKGHDADRKRAASCSGVHPTIRRAVLQCAFCAYYPTCIATR